MRENMLFPSASRCDMHTHSNHSCDARDSIDAMAAAAIARGVRVLALTDHIDWHPNDMGFDRFDFGRFSDEFEAARDKYRDQLLLLKGFEAGEPQNYRALYERELSRDYDVIIGSQHWVGGAMSGDPTITPARFERYINTYLINIIRMIELGGFQILAHLTFPLQYYGQHALPMDLVCECLQKAAARGMALEINTKSLRKGFPAPMPTREIVQLFAQVGGQFVTFGSDAHRTHEIAHGFEKLPQLLADTALVPVYFQNRQAVGEPLGEQTHS